MPATNAHIARAEENERFYKLTLTLGPQSYLHWSVAALFYSALHYVEACLHEQRTSANPRGINSEDHAARSLAIRRNFPRIYQDYRTLQDRSEDARYRLVAFTEHEVKDLETHEFSSIKAFARSRLGLERP